MSKARVSVAVRQADPTDAYCEQRILILDIEFLEAVVDKLDRETQQGRRGAVRMHRVLLFHGK